MSDIKILQVKLIKQGEGLELSFRNNEGVLSADSKECKEAVHPDMVKAVNELAIHLAIHTDYLTEKQATDRELLTPFIVTGYSWNQKETGITLTGVRSTTRSKSVVLNIMLPMDGDAADEYTLQKDFVKKIKKVEAEVHAYLKGEKKLQGTLDMPERDGKMQTVTNMKIDTPIDATGMDGKEKEFTPGEYVAEVDHTTALREAGKVVPIKKGKKKTESTEEVEYTPEMLEKRASERRANRGGKEKKGNRK
jgi:hypothetical protein